MRRKFADFIKKLYFCKGKIQIPKSLLPDKNSNNNRTNEIHVPGTMKERLIEIFKNEFSQYGYKWLKSQNSFVKRHSSNTKTQIYISFNGPNHKKYFIVGINLNAHYADFKAFCTKFFDHEQPYSIGRFMAGNVVGIDILDEYTFFQTDSEDRFLSKANAIKDAITKYGLPFLENMTNPDYVIQELKKWPMGPIYFGYLPIAYLVWKQDKNAALQCVDETLKLYKEDVPQEQWALVDEWKKGNRDIPCPSDACIYEKYLEFAEKFRAYADIIVHYNSNYIKKYL